MLTNVSQYTDGHYQFGINHEEGGISACCANIDIFLNALTVILALNLKAPEYTVDWPEDELPELRRASDIMYGLWKTYLEGSRTDSLRYVMTVQITNEKTKSIIVRAVGEGKISEWPGTYIGVGETNTLNEAALALLGM
jgi:hypothetical protein